MRFLNEKEFFVRHVENQIRDIKARGEEAVEEALEQFHVLADSPSRQHQDYREVFGWLVSSLTGDTEQIEVNKLTEAQTQYALNVVSAVFDCVTMVV